MTPKSANNISICRHKKVDNVADLMLCAIYAYKAYWDMGTVTPRTAKRILQQTGRDVSNYRIVLRDNELKHFYYRHYSEKQHGQRGFTFNDLQKLPAVLGSMARANPEPGNAIRIKTQFPHNEIFELIVIIDDAKRILYGKSFRIKTWPSRVQARE